LPEDRTESRFADIWRERNKIQPEITIDWVDNDWAKGRNQFLTFLIRIRDEKLIQKIIEIQDKLSTIPCVDPFPKAIGLVKSSNPSVLRSFSSFNRCFRCSARASSL